MTISKDRALAAVSRMHRSSDIGQRADDAAEVRDFIEQQAAEIIRAQDLYEIVVGTVAGALSRAGVTECDDPGEAIDVLIEGFKARIAELEQSSGAQGEPYCWWANTTDPDHSCICWNESDAESEVSEHGGAVIALYEASAFAQPPVLISDAPPASAQQPAGGAGEPSVAMTSGLLKPAPDNKWREIAFRFDAQRMLFRDLLRAVANRVRYEPAIGLPEHEDLRALIEQADDALKSPPPAQHPVAVLVSALEKIERWNEFPETGKVWEESGNPVSYGAAFGSNGERDYMRRVASDALAEFKAWPDATAEQPAEQPRPMQVTVFVAGSGESRNALYEGQHSDETPEQAATRLHWVQAALEFERKQQQPAVPEGWRIERTEDGRIIVQKKGAVGYVASEVGKSGIAESALYYLADALLSAQKPGQSPDDLIHVGYTNPAQIKYAKEESGFFYPDTDQECHIPLYMQRRHLIRLGHDHPTLATSKSERERQA